MTIGERIRSIRQSKGISQTELANATGIKKQNLYKYENNIITNIPSDRIEAISRHLDVSPAVIMGWEDSEKMISPEYETPDSGNRNVVKIAARDGTYQEHILSDSQLAAVKAVLDQFPDASDDL